MLAVFAAQAPDLIGVHLSARVALHQILRAQQQRRALTNQMGAPSQQIPNCTLGAWVYIAFG
jgi:hypothetical protein